MIYDINDRSTYARFNITGASTDASGYVKLAVTHVASNNTFSAADELSVHFSRLSLIHISEPTRRRGMG